MHSVVSTTLSSKFQQLLTSYPYESDSDCEYLRKAIDEYKSAAKESQILLDERIPHKDAREARARILAKMNRADQFVQKFVGHSLPDVAPMKDSGEAESESGS